MKVDIEVRTLIRRPREDVAAHAADPSTAPLWYRNITSVEWLTPPPVGNGTRMTLRNAGSPSGFGALAAPVIARAMRRATTQDLNALREILESAGSAG